MSKIQFWKQFTTLPKLLTIFLQLYSICQRYNFESNLQRYVYQNPTNPSCIRYVKDTILKAIYNTSWLFFLYPWAVFDMSKIQFWKQFTTIAQSIAQTTLLYSICQRYNFESNLQPSTPRSLCSISCIRYVKDTILKAIYNMSSGVMPKHRAVFDMSKIQY